MITGFDIGIFLAVLLAMLVSRMPKRWAMSVAVYALLAVGAANWWLVGGDKLYWAIIGIEILAALVLAEAAPRLARYADRVFFRLMSGMFCLSGLLSLTYLSTAMTFETYTSAWHVLALIHVGLMGIFADGTGSLIRGLGLFGNRGITHVSDR